MHVCMMETIVFLNSDIDVCTMYRSNMVSLFDILTLLWETITTCLL